MKKYFAVAALLLGALVVGAGLWSVSQGSSEQSSAGSASEADAGAEARPKTPFIAGWVLDSTGAPIEGATVEAADGASATSDADGRFRLDDLEPGTHRLDASADGFVVAGPETMRRVEVVLSEDESAASVDDLELVLRRPATVRGRVQASGRALADARIGVYYLSAEGLSDRLEPFVVDDVTRSGERGRFELDHVIPGRLRLLVEASDYAVTESRELYLEPGETHEGLVIDLDPSATLSGQVVDTEGSAVAAKLVLRGGSLGRSRTVDADSSGRFSFRDVPAGSYALEARASGYRTELVEGVEAEPTKVTEQDVVMEAAGGIFGRVVDPDGQPVASSFVWFRPENARPKMVSTDEEGRFQWDEAPPQATTATAISQHYDSSRPQRLRSGSEATLKLRAGGAVRGRVVGPDGRPVPSFSVGVESLEVDGPRPYRPRSVGVHKVNDSAGRFAFDSLRPGKYWFRVQTDRYASASSEQVLVRRGRDTGGVTIRVGQAGSVAGQITDSETGQGVAGARVALFDPTSPFSANQTRTDGQGRYHLDGVPPGRRSLRVVKKNFLSTVSAGVQVRPGGETTRNVQIRKQKPGERMQFHGIGAVLRKTGDGVLVQNVMDGHPASEFGLERGDIIRGVDRDSIDGMRLDQVIEQIRGEQGAAVELEIERKGQGTMTLEIERGQVIVKE